MPGAGFTPFGASPEIAQSMVTQFNLGGAGAGLFSGTQPNSAPAAYLNYILYDQNFDSTTVLVGHQAVSATAATSFEPLSFNGIPITRRGYLYIYVSNETMDDVNVHFDELTITHKFSKIVQSDDYYPFGLTFNSYQRSFSQKNDYLFNGMEYVDDLGLNLNMTMFRPYDPALGRFTGIDPLADIFSGISPYSFAVNNPILLGDPTGLGPIINFFKKLFGVRGRVGDDGSKQHKKSQKSINHKGAKRPKKSKNRNKKITPTSARSSSGSTNSSSSNSKQPSGPSAVKDIFFLEIGDYDFGVPNLSYRSLKNVPNEQINRVAESLPSRDRPTFAPGRTTTIDFDHDPFETVEPDFINKQKTMDFLKPYVTELNNNPNAFMRIIIDVGAGGDENRDMHFIGTYPAKALLKDRKNAMIKLLKDIGLLNSNQVNVDDGNPTWWTKKTIIEYTK